MNRASLAATLALWALLALICVWLLSCTTVSVTMPDGATFKRSAFLQQTTLEVTPTPDGRYSVRYNVQTDPLAEALARIALATATGGAAK